MQKLAANLLAGRGGRQRLSILIFHRVLPSRDPFLQGTIDAHDFREIVSTLKEVFNVVPLPEAVDRLASNSLPPRSACITFDDGYADNVEVALPILEAHGVPATFFITTSFLDGGIMWNDEIFDIMRRVPGAQLDLASLGMPCYDLEQIEARRLSAIDVVAALKYLPTKERNERVEKIRNISGLDRAAPLMMTVDQLRMLRDAGMEIGAHTISHPILARLDESEARREIVASKQCLEDILGAPIRCFAYPNGKPGIDYTSRDVALVKEAGFVCALSTSWGVATRDCDRHQLPRFTPWDRNRHRFVMRLLANYLRDRPDALATDLVRAAS